MKSDIINNYILLKNNTEFEKNSINQLFLYKISTIKYLDANEEILKRHTLNIIKTQILETIDKRNILIKNLKLLKNTKNNKNLITKILNNILNYQNYIKSHVKFLHNL